MEPGVRQGGVVKRVRLHMRMFSAKPYWGILNVTGDVLDWSFTTDVLDWSFTTDRAAAQAGRKVGWTECYVGSAYAPVKPADSCHRCEPTA